MPEEITPELLLGAYAGGYFPMAASRRGRALRWYSPDPRAILPLESLHLPRSLKKAVRRRPFVLSVDRAFPEVIAACSEPRERGQQDSWINPRIRALYTELWRQGFAHSVECRRDDRLVGGLYGVSLGGAFFGESMFSKAENASRIALVYLAEILIQAGYTLLDTQFVNPHLLQFGVIEIGRDDYLARLSSALALSPNPSSSFSISSRSVMATDPSDFKVMRPSSQRSEK